MHNAIMIQAEFGKARDIHEDPHKAFCSRDLRESGRESSERERGREGEKVRYVQNKTQRDGGSIVEPS